MTDFARLVLDTDTRGLRDGERDLRGVGDQARRTAREVDGAASGMSSAFKKVGVALVAAGIGNVIYDFGKQSVQAAIDAQEMQSAFEVVFGSMAEDVRSWAEETGNTLGRSTQEIQRAALSFQELFGKALDPAQSAELSKQFAVLTQDLASFKNLSNEVAQQKLFSGLVGEAEPLRAVGVFLSENALKARAAAMGLGDFSKELTDQQKIVVRAAEIQAQLAQASGDVERTSGSTANQIKTYNAAVEELQVAIGQKLLPQLTPLVTVTAELVTAMANAAQSINVTSKATANFVEGLRVVGGLVSRAASTMGGFASAIGLTGGRLDWLNKKAQFLINPLSTVISLIERVGRAERIQQRVSSLINGSFSTDFIAGELAAMGKGVTAINAPSALPAASANLDKVASSARRAASAAKEAEREFEGLYERLFPEDAAQRQYEADLKLIRSQDNLTAARRKEIEAALEQERIRKRAGEFMDLEIDNRQFGLIGQMDALRSASLGFDAILGAADFGIIGGFAKPFEEFDATLGETADMAETQTTRIAESFAQMSQKITSTLQGLANSIRSGNFLGIFSGILDIFMQLGSAGVFGKSIQTTLNQPVAGARAMGGQVNAGRTYLVGERGPELFTPSGHGRIIANDNMGGGMVFNIDARGATDPEAVRQQVQQGILEAAPSIVAAAEQRTISSLRRPRLAGVL